MSTTTEKVERLKLKHLIPAEGNRPNGSGMSAKSIGELAASITAQGGIQQPLIVRPHPTEKGRYEIGAGHRRHAAALKLELADVPCLVRDLTDQEIREVRIIENLQREKLHELEEAAGYSEMLAMTDAKGKAVYTWETLAGKIGKSAAFVRARVKLLDMPDLAKQAMLCGKLSASVALLLSRIVDPKQAHKATVEILDRYSGREESALNPDTEAMSFRHAKDHIQSKYMKRLKGVPFDQEDRSLVPVYGATGKPLEGDACLNDALRCGGGACADCPFRSGNMKSLFPDAEAADVCTNTRCLQKKLAAHQRREEAKAAEKGQTLLKPKVADRVLNHEGGLSYQGRQQFVALNEKPEGKKKTWGEILEKAGVEHEVVVAPHGAKKVLLVPIGEALVQAAKTAGIAVELPKATDPAAQQAQAAAHEVLEAVEKDVKTLLGQRLRLAKNAADVRALFATEYLSQGGDHLSDKAARKLDDTELFARCLEATINLDPFNYQGDPVPDTLKLYADFGVDVPAVLKAHEAEAAKEAALEVTDGRQPELTEKSKK